MRHFKTMLGGLTRRATSDKYGLKERNHRILVFISATFFNNQEEYHYPSYDLIM